MVDYCSVKLSNPKWSVKYGSYVDPKLHTSFSSRPNRHEKVEMYCITIIQHIMSRRMCHTRIMEPTALASSIRISGSSCRNVAAAQTETSSFCSSTSSSLSSHNTLQTKGCTRQTKQSYSPSPPVKCRNDPAQVGVWLHCCSLLPVSVLLCCWH